jgi:hypothetical protein
MKGADMSSDKTLEQITGLTNAQISDLISGIALDAAVLKRLPADAIINHIDCWNLKVDPNGYSIDAMSDEELQQAVIEDLLLVVKWRMDGKEVGGDFHHLTRFLDEEQSKRVAKALEAPMVKSLITVVPTGAIEITPEHMQDAMDFCGFWLDGWDILAEGTVICLPPGR